MHAAGGGFIARPIWLHFEDGTSFEGLINRERFDPIWGEAAFTTAMTGYEETVTDPSFLGQHIIFTTSHVGNYPSDPIVRQSPHCHATALMARHFSPNSFLEGLERPLISRVDTRSLVTYLVRTKASHKSVLTDSPIPPKDFKTPSLICNDLSRVSQRDIRVEVSGENPIALINYGVKQAIKNNLVQLGFPLVTFPYDTPADKILSYNPRMIFLSNGPGDPQNYKEQIHVLRELLHHPIPIRGICLGHQLIALALGVETERLPFGQRGINHPIFDYRTGAILITSQNHGYTVNDQSFKKLVSQGFFVSHRSLFDGSIEGICESTGKIESVQFHPEASPGPSDGAIFFREIKRYLREKKKTRVSLYSPPTLGKKRKDIPYKTVLLIGPGPIRIGQASEFDYSGTQALKALKEVGIKVILLNSNPATIMTDPEMADKTYLGPITKDAISSILDKENIDAVISTMGGQTALNICMELKEAGILSKKKVALLGATVETIRKTEDRNLFACELESLGYKSGKRYQAANAAEARGLANTQVAFPLIIRRDFALGGKGALLVKDRDELDGVLEKEINYPITLEKSLLGFKEIELEVMVDQAGDGIIVCSIENVDPCGVHTGDSITVAPVQTISDYCYQQLRDQALTIAKHMGVVAGGANVQFAINPKDESDIIVIEMNPRVSRSSALASKVTGYPIAKISALLAVGYTLKEILNDITRSSPVAFEPTQDYVSIKIPLFPFNKFPVSSNKLGPAMRSVGEVLGLGGSFPEAFLKALRSMEIGLEIPQIETSTSTSSIIDRDYISKRLSSSRELCLLSVLEALRKGMSTDEIHQLSNISPWFIQQMALIFQQEIELKKAGGNLDKALLQQAKSLGLSDKHIAFLTGTSEENVFSIRKKCNLFPNYRAVDTCSGEFQALTPYFYSTYSSPKRESSPLDPEKAVIILGSGPNRIGQGIEFDYSCVKATQRLKEKGIHSIMVNSNPETVSTDYDISDRLYLSPLYSEELFDIFCHENPKGIIASFSGQTGIKIREKIETSFRKQTRTFNFLGPSLKAIQQVEDRKEFAEIIEKLGLKRNPSKNITGFKNLLHAVGELGLPVIIRPSYVIGGESIYILQNTYDLEHMPQNLLKNLKKTSLSFHVEKYLKEAIEYDVDIVRDKHGHLVQTICEHIEYAGVHSGDSGMITPPLKLTHPLHQKIRNISQSLADTLQIEGPMNFQYAIKGDSIYCIEANPRGSRTLPFLSKTFNISLPKLATDAMLGETIEERPDPLWNFYAVKQSTFPFDHFLQDSIILGPIMRSTGETFGIDYDIQHAILKSYLGNYPNLNRKGKIFFSLSDPHKNIITYFLKQLDKCGHTFCATHGTYNHIKNNGFACEHISKIKEKGRTILDLIKEDAISFVINTPNHRGPSKSDGESIRSTAIQHGVPIFTRPENIKAVLLALTQSQKTNLRPYALQDIYIQPQASL